MKPHIRRLLQRKTSPVKSTYLAINPEDRDKGLPLKIVVQSEIAEKLDSFLKEKGLPEREGIQTLIEYGLSDEDEEELEKLRSEKESQVSYMHGKYATMKFRAYELFVENRRITMKLNMLLSENRLLKKRLKDEGLQDPVSKDEWDDWDKDATEKYYRKYVFLNRA